MSVTAPAGFAASGGSAGIKPDGSPDLALILAASPIPAAAVFTTSRTAAPPVHLGRRTIQGGRLRSIVVNSGCANAGTGAAGLVDAEQMRTAAAEAIGSVPDEVLVCSTGPIGPRVPVGRIGAALPELVAGAGATPDHGLRAARAIMTTDTVPKQAVSDRSGWRVGGMAKGAGMVRPDMATMLAFLTTDAVVEAAVLDRALRRAVDVTFHCLTIDGCRSTNDTVAVMASGESGVVPVEAELETAITEVCRSLARQMAADAEGATRVVDLAVRGTASDSDARTLAMAITDSALVRSSFYGADPNWGRILGALGVTPVPVDPDAVEISYEGVVMARGGIALPVDEAEVSALMSGDFSVEVIVGEGPGRAEIVTTDLTPDYVRFNGERS